ncbi:hypothetical protein [Mesoterricola sediminis]|nr:hypothetical protein [Mesoterricola sediminis]
MDQDGQVSRAGASGKRPVNGGNVDTTGISEGPSRRPIREVESHASNYRTDCDIRKSESRTCCEIAMDATRHHHLGMSRPRKQRPDDIWPQRLFVLGLIDAEVSSGVVTYEDLAKEFGLGTTYSLLTGWRYNLDRKPERAVVEKIAKRYHINPWDVYNPAPAQPVVKDELALACEALEGAMGQDVVGQLTDEQKLHAYRVAMAAARAVLSQ